MINRLVNPEEFDRAHALRAKGDECTRRAEVCSSDGAATDAAYWRNSAQEYYRMARDIEFKFAEVQL